MSAGRVLLEIDGPIAIITNDHPEKHNAFTDEMDFQLFDILGELKARRDIRAVIWRGAGKSFSSGRDVAAIGGGKVAISHHELMSGGHRGILQMLDIQAPVIVAMKGWTIGHSFQRALIADIRIAAEGAKMMLPEVTHGVIPDTGGVARLYQICGHGVVSDLVLTGRAMGADEALGHGIISRIVPPDDLDSAAMEMATTIASRPTVVVKMARKVIANLAEPGLRAAMNDELIYQTFITQSADFAEMRAARREGRAPVYTGS